MSIKKKAGTLALLAGGASVLSLMAAAPAFADMGWDPSDMIETTTDSGVDFADVSQESFAEIVTQITTFLFGLAIVAVVLRIVLTALDRLVFGNARSEGQGGGGGRGRGGGGNDTSLLSSIPLVGAYPPETSWPDILKNVIKNVAIIAGAWVLVNFLVGIVNFIFTTLME